MPPTLGTLQTTRRPTGHPPATRTVVTTYNGDPYARTSCVAEARILSRFADFVACRLAPDSAIRYPETVTSIQERGLS